MVKVRKPAAPFKPKDERWVEPWRIIEYVISRTMFFILRETASVFQRILNANYCDCLTSCARLSKARHLLGLDSEMPIFALTIGIGYSGGSGPLFPRDLLSVWAVLRTAVEHYAEVWYLS
jgi:hypothetical protein